MASESEKLVTDMLRKDKIKEYPKRIINSLERLVRDISLLSQEAEKHEAEMKLNHEETNFSSWDYKARIERKERWIKYFLGKALELGLDKGGEIVESIIPDAHVKISDYIVSRCQMYQVMPYMQRIEAGLVEPAVAPAPTSILPSQIEQVKPSEPEQKFAAAGG